MTSEFISVEEIPKKLAEFSNLWFEVAQQLEGLSNFKSGFDGRFKSRLKGLLSDGERCGLFIDDICISSQHHLPGGKEDFEESRKNIVGAFDELRQVFEKDIESLDRHESLATKITELEKRLNVVIEQHEEVNSHALKSCNHYEIYKKEYDWKIHNIKEATNEKIRAIQKRFMDDITTIFEGYKIFTIEKNDEIGLELFFERMIKDPDYPEKVNIVSRGLSFGKKKSDIRARLVLLKYKARDITQELAPILDDESRRVERFQPELKRLHELEMRCTELRDEDDRLSTLKKVIEDDLDVLNAEDEDTLNKFQTYESLLELRDSYLKTFNSTARFRKGLSDLITSSFEEYEPIEPDVEKRELKEDINGLKQNIAVLNNEKTKILERFEHAKKELINRADTIASITQKGNALKTELEKTSNTLSETLGERDGLKKENTDLSILLKETGESVTELEKLKDSTENKLLNTASDLEKTLDERDGLVGAKKMVEDSVVELENANEKLKRHLEDAAGKLEVTVREYERSQEGVKHYKEKLQEAETAIEELEKLKDSTENKLLNTASDLEKTLDERDGLIDAKKMVEDSVVELENANEKLKRHLEVTTEKLQEKETAIEELEKRHDRIVTKQATTTTVKKTKKIIAAQSDKAVVKKKIETLREKKRK